MTSENEDRSAAVRQRLFYIVSQVDRWADLLKLSSRSERADDGSEFVTEYLDSSAGAEYRSTFELLLDEIERILACGDKCISPRVCQLTTELIADVRKVGVRIKRQSSFSSDQLNTARQALRREALVILALRNSVIPDNRSAAADPARVFLDVLSAVEDVLDWAKVVCVSTESVPDHEGGGDRYTMRVVFLHPNSERLWAVWRECAKKIGQAVFSINASASDLAAIGGMLDHMRELEFAVGFDSADQFESSETGTNKLNAELAELRKRVSAVRSILFRQTMKVEDPVIQSVVSTVDRINLLIDSSTVADDYRVDLAESLREVKICFREACYIAVMSLCGKILEVSLKQRLINNGVFDQGKHDQLGIGQLLSEIQKQDVGYLPEDLKNTANIIKNYRNSAAHPHDEGQVPSVEQTMGVFNHTIDMLSRTLQN